MKNLTWPKAIETVLEASGEPLHVQEITDRILEQGLKKHGGATPAQAVSAVLTTDVKRDEPNSLFERVRPGIYRLRGARPGPIPPDSLEESVPLVTSFGLYWDRAAVDWQYRPHIYGEYQTTGRARSDLTRVDFGAQHGIYLLHDGREVIYVGRTTTGDLGRRLSDHTRDRLQGRWTRFSWFGFRPVKDDGTLGDKLTDLPPDFGIEKLIGAFEAILIEALEPRQNKKSGDDFGAIEFRQVPDPEVKKKLLQAAVLDL